jgi:alkanesulfonate monooxygenase SsuD/methylene tetrahydromethanopterin reductase-like flavin-dependent oxidoreductase (luciferase family)
MEEGIATLRSAWSGQPFEFHGTTVRVMPRPFQQPGPPLVMGGSSAAAARRAARNADGFAPTDPALMQVYRDELIALGRDPGPEPPAAGVGGTTVETLVAVSDDPQATWARVVPHCLHELNTYHAWLRDIPGGVKGFWEESDGERLRSAGRYLVLTPEQLLARAKAQGGAITIEPLLGGIAPEVAWQSLELIQSRVLPHLS